MFFKRCFLSIASIFSLTTITLLLSLLANDVLSSRLKMQSKLKMMMNGKPPEAVNLNITQLLEKKNYKVETHEVTTQDGYILKLFKIPGNNTKENTMYNPKRKVLMVHGLFVCILLTVYFLGLK